MKKISTGSAPQPIGPYSQAILHEDVVYISGQGPLDPATGDSIGGDAQTQTQQTLANISHIIEAAGTTLDQIVKTTIYLSDMNYYEMVNETYEEFMALPYPARTAVGVEGFPIDIDVEIEAIAIV